MESMDMMDFLILDELVSEEEAAEKRRQQEEEIAPEDYVKDDFGDFDDL